MRSTRVISGIVFSVILFAGLSSFAQLKKRVAVFTFEDKSERSWRWWDGKGPGDGMADMLTTELVKSGKYTVIERQEIARILEEQRMGQSGLVTPQSAAQIGKLLGVELAIMGAVTEFGYARGSTGGRIRGIGVGVQKQEATVAVDVRFVNTTTGEILMADNVRKNLTRSGVSVSTPQASFRDRSDFDNSLVGKATRESIESIMEMIDKQMTDLPWEGKVLTVQGTTVFIKPGSDAGVSMGDVFVVYSPGEELIDPDTGMSLGSIESKAGTIEVTGFVSGGKAARAVVKSGSGIKQGDLVRLK